MKVLTEKQQKILDYIHEYTSLNACPPTIREIASHFDISLKAIQDHIAALRKKGYIAHSEKKSRTLRILKNDNVAFLQDQVTKIPFLGTVAAGKPIFCDENFDGYFSLPSQFLTSSGKYFALKVKGMSMKNAGILDGDIAVIHYQETAENGDIVVAIIEDSVTLKRFYKEATRFCLQPENEDFNPIYCQDLRILGKLSNIIRNY